MRYFILTISVFLLSFIGRINCQQCDNLVIRRNIKSITPSEWSNYVNALRTLARNGDLDQLAQIHDSNFRDIHDCPQFLVWHRYFLYDFETRLRRIDSSLALPYWDAAADFDAPHTSIVFADSHFGGNGNPNADYCISTGLQANLTIGYPENRCLRRHFQGPTANTISAWQSPAYITSIIQTSSNYDSFRRNLEHSLHNSMHFGIGGRSGDLSTSWSPIDLIFYPHHANIDRIWAKWQTSESQNLLSIDGNQRYPDGTVRRINRNWPLTYYGIRVREILNTVQPSLCYTYDDIITPRQDLSAIFEEKFSSQFSSFLIEQYFPKLLTKTGRSLVHDFSDVESLNLLLDKSYLLPYPLVLPGPVIRKLGLNLADVMDVQLRSSKFVHDINKELLKAHKNVQVNNEDDVEEAADENIQEE